MYIIQTGFRSSPILSADESLECTTFCFRLFSRQNPNKKMLVTKITYFKSDNSRKLCHQT